MDLMHNQFQIHIEGRVQVTRITIIFLKSYDIVQLDSDVFFHGIGLSILS